MENNKTIEYLKKHKEFLYIVYCCVLLIIFVFASEVILRIKEIRPWNSANPVLTVEPGGRLFSKDSALGYVNLPGHYIVHHNNNEYSFEVTHLENTHRITHLLETYKNNKPKKEIWIFGCSFTYGWYLNDTETFPYLLQQKFPDYEFVNYGVCGYGTIHSLIQLKEELEQGRKPEIAIIAYTSAHDVRNTCVRSWRKGIIPWNRLGLIYLPYARLDNNGNLQYGMMKGEYNPFPFMQYSSLIHFIEIQYNKFQDNYYHSHDVSKALILEFNKLCKENQIKLIVAGVRNDPVTLDMLSFCHKNDILGIDISVDLNIKENTNLPYDAHPSAKADYQYALKLGNYLKEKVLPLEKTAVNSGQRKE